MKDIVKKDYRHTDLHALYKLVGFFAIIVGTFFIAFKVAAWFMWAQQCINASL